MLSCETKDKSCCGCGPGYASPRDAFLHGPREKALFVAVPNCDRIKPDRIVSVDVDPESPTYCQVLSSVIFPYSGDEVHHTGWNACSSCYNDPSKKRKYLVAPCLNSSRIYFIDIEDPKNLKLHKVVEPEALFEHDVSFPHTTHCLADGNIMISTLGTAKNDPKGDFLLINGSTFEPVGTWPSKGTRRPAFNYDFWYQPKRNVMISTEWGSPKHIKQGLKPDELLKREIYGNKIHIWNWTNHTLEQTVELELPDGLLPFEIRFHHNPESTHGFFGSALGSAIYHFFKPEEDGEFVVEKVVSVSPKPVKGWMLPEMPALISDIILSMDDKYLYFSCWLHGEVRQYDVSVPSAPVLVGQVFIGGCDEAASESSGEVVKETPRLRSLKGEPIDGAPQMLQLSLDGKRLYVTTSLYSVWDKQIYPDLIKNGSKMLQIDCNTETGGLTVNEDFLIDFGKLEDGPCLAHEMRYPGGDCTSDIWC